MTIELAQEISRQLKSSPISYSGFGEILSELSSLVAHNASWLREFLRRDATEWTSPVANFAWPRMTLLSEVLKQNRANRGGIEYQALLRERVSELIGIGDGLTPSGDDFLVGLSAVLRRYQSAPLLSAIDLSILNRTTDVSASFLSYAQDGLYSENIHRVLMSISSVQDEQVESLESAVNALLSAGGTSGADTLLGILFGLCLHLK